MKTPLNNAYFAAAINICEPQLNR